MGIVLVTDHAWPDVEVEQSVLAGAGHSLVVARSHREIAQLARDADAIMTCFAPVDAETLRAAAHCRTVARFGVGVDNIDVATATRLGMIVTNVPDYCQHEVADHTMALLLALLRRLVDGVRSVRDGGWAAPAGVRRVQGLTLGLVGYGSIGRQVALRATAFGLRVVAVSGSRPADDGVTRFVDSLPELLGRSDIVSLHVPLTSATSHLIDRSALASMRRGSLLLNTARGGLVDADALFEALESGHLAGAGLDVTEPEPLPADHPLRCRPDVLVTPHVAFASDGSIEELTRRTARNVVDVLAGRGVRDVVNPDVFGLGVRATTAAT